VSAVATKLHRPSDLLGLNTLESGQNDDICDWIESNFYVPAGRDRTLLNLMLHQKGILRFAFTRDKTDHFPYTTIIFSTVKKSGKTTIGAAVGRWFAETQTSYSSILCLGNDERQATERAFAFIKNSIALTPGYDKKRDILRDRWKVATTYALCLESGTKIEAVGVDAAGEAGGAPALTLWTELWGFETREAIEFWNELTPVPTLPDSIRWVDTYAGYDGGSDLLRSLYDKGKESRQLTNDEFAKAVCRDVDGEHYDDFLHAFDELHGDPNSLVPIWVNEASGQFMYWDEEIVARRMPWLRGVAGERYYREQEAQLPPNAYNRFHRNVWVGDESDFVPMISWNNCYDPSLEPLVPGDKTPIVLGVDAASTGDCFGIVAVSRHPKRHDDVAVRACRKWTPPKGGIIDYSEPEDFLRWICLGGCVNGHPRPTQYRPAIHDDCPLCVIGRWDVPPHNVVHIAYDAYQLVDMMQRIYREDIAWAEGFSQQSARLEADRRLHDLIIMQRIAHDGDPDLKEHIRNANGKTQKDQDSTMRIVKRHPDKKIDLVVCLSMATDKCLELLL